MNFEVLSQLEGLKEMEFYNWSELVWEPPAFSASALNFVDGSAFGWYYLKIFLGKLVSLVPAVLYKNLLVPQFWGLYLSFVSLKEI